MKKMKNFQDALNHIYIKCWNDEGFKKKFFDHPKETLNEYGLHLKSDMNVLVR